MLTKVTAKIIYPFIKLLRFLTPLGDLIARVWVAQIFFVAGILKIQSWESTLALFEYEYHVPFLSPYVAAVIGTTAELILPVLLAVGLGGRFWIFALFIYNIVAVAAYPFLWTPEGSTGLQQHIGWGILLMLLMFHGSGKLSLDHWIHKKYGHLLI
ncbi:MAG: hypothetical protein K0Q74_151 [Gammaproteobacteria bacterium]|nr:hypothetical protein [Gammaproteobacteria bacterium]